MADPRANVSFNEINRHATTFKSTGLTISDAPTAGTDIGAAVTMTSSDTVGKGSAGNTLVGQVVKYEQDGMVAVQDQGYCRFAYSGTAPVVGTAVEVDGAGNVRAATSTNIGAKNTVVSVDAATGTCMVNVL